MAITIYEPQKSQGTGKAFTPEEQAAYDKKWALFVQKMANRPVKGVRQFRGVITEIREPEVVANTYPGAAPGSTRTIRKIIGEITERGMEGLRFLTDSADNPRNDKTKLYAAYVAVFKEAPPPAYTRWAFDYDTLLNVPLLLNIEKGGPRQDNKRGGIKAYLVGFDALYDDDEDDAPVRGERTNPTGGATLIVRRLDEIPDSSTVVSPAKTPKYELVQEPGKLQRLRPVPQQDTAADEEEEPWN